MSSKNEEQSRLQILSKLAATRNIIKKKYRQAYADRQMREHKISEILKPITSGIDSLKGRSAEQDERIEKTLLLSPSPSQLSKSPESVYMSDEEESLPMDYGADNMKTTSALYTPKPPKPRQLLYDSVVDEPTSTASDIVRTTKEREAIGGMEIERDKSGRRRFYAEPLGQRTRSKLRQGKAIQPFNNHSIDFDFIPYNRKNRIIYEYFDDPNELCERLQLLISSRMAGNTNHKQEINSIIEELRELKCIY